MIRKNLSRLYLLLAVLLASTLSQAQNAYLKEGVTTMDTYGFGDPNPVPNPDNLYYPYFRYDGYSTDKVSKQWKTVEMENPYIKVTLFPEIGGKIWGAIDKSSGQEFIYYNHVVKFRDIALRGAWVSGGIEFNFGIIGHVPTSATPIDYVTKEKADGSVSCYISSFELLTRTYWTVEVNLPKDKAYFTTHTTWHNSSSLDQPYYHWMNAAYHSSPEMEFCYPGDHFIGHDGDLHNFPMDGKGHNISWYKENAFEDSKSYHVLGYYNDFYGAYWHDKDFGSVHYSPYDEKLGMKIFLWSQARDGAIWEDLLTDNDGQYVELQSGKMFNQPGDASAWTTFKNTAFRPGATDEWTEYWYPTKGTKGVVKSSPAGSLNITRENGTTTLYFSPLQDMNTSVKMESNGKTIFSEKISFKTLQTWSHKIDASLIPSEGKLKVTIGDKALFYSEEESDNQAVRPRKMPADFDWNSVYGLYTTGEQYMLQKKDLSAEKYLKAALEKDKYFAPALNRLSSLYLRWGRYDEALKLSSTAISLNAYDGEANYLYGLCNLRLGNFTDAKDGFSVAAYDPAMRSVAYSALAGVSIREKNWNKAVSEINKSLIANPQNLSAKQELMVCYRNMGEKEKAIELQRQVLEDLPLAQGIRYEQYLLNPSESNKAAFTSMIRNELPKETYMELSSWYEMIGRTDEAIDLLAFVNNDPVAAYKKAWLLSQKGEDKAANNIIEQVNGMSVEMAFPFRAEDIKALEWACTKTSSWKPIYLLAILYHSCGNKDKATELLRSCTNADFAPFYLYRATLVNGNDRLADLKKAESLDKSWRTGKALIRHYEAQKDYKQACETAANYYKMFPKNNTLGFLYGKTLCENGEYSKSVALLKKITVLPAEGSYDGRDAYRKANLFEAMEYLKKGNGNKALQCINASKQWIENLGVGKPYDEQIDYRIENYMEAKAILKTNPKKATELLQKTAVIPKVEKNFNSSNLLVAITMREIGHKAEADEWVGKWLNEYKDNPMADWCVAIYNGDTTRANSIMASRNNVTEASPWDNVYIDREFDLIAKLFGNQ